MKRIIEVEEMMLGDNKVYKVKGCKSMIFDEWGFENLTKPYVEEEEEFRPKIGGVYEVDCIDEKFVVMDNKSSFSYVVFDDGACGTIPYDSFLEMKCQYIGNIKIMDFINRIKNVKTIDEGYQE